MADNRQDLDDQDADRKSPKTRLRKLWSRVISTFSPHHMRPSSRRGNTNQYNLFPWWRRPHMIWHNLFFNMTIMEVWDQLAEIYSKVFDNNSDYVTRDWIEVCCLDDYKAEDHNKVAQFERDKISFMHKRSSAIKMQADWEICFGGYSLERAIFTMRYMMLFMIFGEAMSDPENKIFVNSHLQKLLDRVPAEGDRRWALNECLGENVSIHSAKSQISEIINKIRP